MDIVLDKEPPGDSRFEGSLNLDFGEYHAVLYIFPYQVITAVMTNTSFILNVENVLYYISSKYTAVRCNKQGPQTPMTKVLLY